MGGFADRTILQVRGMTWWSRTGEKHGTHALLLILPRVLTIAQHTTPNVVARWASFRVFMLRLSLRRAPVLSRACRGRNGELEPAAAIGS